jgi:hypothetical protein
MLEGILIWIGAMIQCTDFSLVNYSVFDPPEVEVRRHRPSCLNNLTLELNPSAQRCLTIFFTGDFAF